MKIITPDYYKHFKCIAGDCTDTCCAGWEVDVDAPAYNYYQSVKGAFGDRLKSVMVPEEEGGCTFTLQEGRCPFLNNKNLCDLFTELGEDKLCDTCAEFPRFINEYGNTKEMGIAPSCKTAGELIFGYEGKLGFDTEEKDEPITHYNDIDPQLYYQLLQARKGAYRIAQNRNWTIDQRCILLLEYAKKIQKKMDQERDDLIANIVKAFAEDQYCEQLLARDAAQEKPWDVRYRMLPHLFDPFPGMEVINPDWFKYLDIQSDFMKMCGQNGGATAFGQMYQEFDAYYQDRMYEYEQLLLYYIFRYFLDAVNDYDLLLKMKITVIGYLVVKHLDVAAWCRNGKQLSKTEQVDIAHLYSRQFEHSYTNYEKYITFFESKRIYAYSNLINFMN